MLIAAILAKAELGAIILQEVSDNDTSNFGKIKQLLRLFSHRHSNMSYIFNVALQPCLFFIFI